jgi:hypothetical protein
VNSASVFGAGSTRVGMTLNVAMKCSAGAGNCLGEAHLLAPKGAKFIDTSKPGKGVKQFRPTAALSVRCPGPCASTTILRVPVAWVALQTHKHKRGKRTVTETVPNPDFLPGARHKHQQVLTLLLVCYGPGNVVTSTETVKLTIRFDKHGQVSYKASDLNGDGKADKKQLRLF